MPPNIALALSFALTLVLWIREQRQYRDVSAVVWLPCVWVMLIGSRSVSQWLSLSTPISTGDLMEGSPLDRTVFIFLIISAFIVLLWRRVGWGEVLRNNAWLFIFIAYCGLSVLWSDYPFVAFKRWIKGFGDLLMALILLSEVNVARATGTMIRRSAYFLVPLSIVFIKYYPDLGRGFDEWSGAPFYTGVTTNKNTLGIVLMVLGLFFVCQLLTRDTGSQPKTRRLMNASVVILFVFMIEYLFRMADSKTPLLALIAASGIVVGLSLRIVRRNFGVFLTVALILGGALQVLFNVTEGVIVSAGRDTTFTGRTDVWAAVLELTVNPIFGAGYESFWLGPRLATMWAKFPVFQPNQAHNGYLEMYVNLGSVGLILWTFVLVAGYMRARERLQDTLLPAQLPRDEFVFAKFGMSFLTAYLLYNVTEATFRPLTLLYLAFLITTVRYAKPKESPAKAANPVPVGAFPVRAARSAPATRAALTGGSNRSSPGLTPRSSPTQAALRSPSHDSLTQEKSTPGVNRSRSWEQFRARR